MAKHTIELAAPVEWVKSLRVEVDFDDKQDEFLKNHLPLAVTDFVKRFSSNMSANTELGIMDSVKKSIGM